MLLLLAGCHRPADIHAVELAACRDAVRAELVDPESARFEAEQFVGEDAGRRVYRLVVNAKNRMGGYAGREGRVCQFDMATGRLVSAGRG